MDAVMKGKRKIFLILVIALLYFLAAKWGLLFIAPSGHTSAIWPASGLAVGFLLIFGIALWPAIFLGAFAGYLTAYSGTSIPTVLSDAGLAAGATAQAYVAAYLMQKAYNWKHLFDAYDNMFAFLLISAGACLIASSSGALILYLGGVIAEANLLQNWVIWWLGDVSGILLYTPLILAWALPIDMDNYLKRSFEGVLLIILTLAASYLCFDGIFTKGTSLTYILMPPMLWGIFRFGAQGTTILAVIISWVAIWGTSQGVGIFAASPWQQTYLLLQLFLVVLASVYLILLAILNESRRANLALESYSVDLQEQVDHSITELQHKAAQQQAHAASLQQHAALLKEAVAEWDARNGALEKIVEEQRALEKRGLEKEKVVSLGGLMADVGKKMTKPLKVVIADSEASQRIIRKIQETLQADQLSDLENHEKVKHHLDQLLSQVEKINSSSKEAHRIILAASPENGWGTIWKP